MSKLSSLALAGLLTVALVGCSEGGDDGASTPTTADPGTTTIVDEPTTTTEAVDETTTTEDDTTTTTSGDTDTSGSIDDLPTIQETTKIYLDNVSDRDRESCEEGPTETRDIYTPLGDTYLRFVCAGSERFTYVVGAEAYEENFEAVSDNLMGRAVFHIPGEAFISPAGANDEFAQAIQDACGCGEVVGPENG